MYFMLFYFLKSGLFLSGTRLWSPPEGDVHVRVWAVHFCDWFVYLHTGWPDFVTITWISESNECQICSSMTKSGTCEELQVLSDSSETRVTHCCCRLYLWYGCTAEGFTMLNIFAESRKKNPPFFLFLSQFGKSFLEYLLYVSVSIHGL